MIDISGLDKSAVLLALFNSAKAQGRAPAGTTPMTKESAADLLKTMRYFDYVEGRVLKVDLGGDMLDTFLYDRDNGNGAARRAILHLLG